METSDLSHHILSRFNADLEGVRSAVLQMGGLVEQQLRNGVKAIYTGDTRLGEEVTRLDHKVNAMEVAIDEDCSRILATRGPTASDLRLIVAVIKTITDLERIGDEAEKLGHIAARSDSPFDPVWTDIAEPGADSTRWLSIPLEPENTTENRLLLHNIELNRIRANSLRAEAYPSLGAYANLGFQTWREDANFLDTDHRWYGVAALGFRLRVPVFDGFKRRNQLALLGIDNQKLEEDRRQLVSARELEYRQARDQVQNNLFALKTQAENVRLAREISETTMLPYKEGTAPLGELLNAQTALAEAETNYSQQTFVYRLSVLKLLKATGQLDLLRQQ